MSGILNQYEWVALWMQRQVRMLPVGENAAITLPSHIVYRAPKPAPPARPRLALVETTDRPRLALVKPPAPRPNLVLVT